MAVVRCRISLRAAQPLRISPSSKTPVTCSNSHTLLDNNNNSTSHHPRAALVDRDRTTTALLPSRKNHRQPTRSLRHLDNNILLASTRQSLLPNLNNVNPQSSRRIASLEMLMRAMATVAAVVVLVE